MYFCLYWCENYICIINRILMTDFRKVHTPWLYAVGIRERRYLPPALVMWSLWPNDRLVSLTIEVYDALTNKLSCQIPMEYAFVHSNHLFSWKITTYFATQQTSIRGFIIPRCIPWSLINCVKLSHFFFRTIFMTIANHQHTTIFKH